jgi:hypothetical protein
MQSMKVNYTNRVLRIRLQKTGQWFAILMDLIKALVETYDQLTKKD